VLGYVRLDDGRDGQLARHIATLERLCAERGLALADVTVEVWRDENPGVPPGLGRALEQLAAGRPRAFAVAHLGHLSGAFDGPEMAAEWFRDHRLTLLAASEHEPAPPAPAAPVAPLRPRRGVLRSPGVGPRSWARYVHARTHAGLRNC
jgi:hypothetical protein